MVSVKPVDAPTSVTLPDVLPAVKRHRAAAVRRFRSAQRLVDQDPAAAEQGARSAIVEIVHAFWWAADSDLEEDHHGTAIDGSDGRNGLRSGARTVIEASAT